MHDGCESTTVENCRGPLEHFNTDGNPSTSPSHWIQSLIVLLSMQTEINGATLQLGPTRVFYYSLFSRPSCSAYFIFLAYIFSPRSALRSRALVRRCILIQNKKLWCKFTNVLVWPVLQASQVFGYRIRYVYIQSQSVLPLRIKLFFPFILLFFRQAEHAKECHFPTTFSNVSPFSSTQISFWITYNIRELSVHNKNIFERWLASQWVSRVRDRPSNFFRLPSSFPRQYESLERSGQCLLFRQPSVTSLFCAIFFFSFWLLPSLALVAFEYYTVRIMTLTLLCTLLTCARACSTLTGFLCFRSAPIKQMLRDADEGPRGLASATHRLSLAHARHTYACIYIATLYFHYCNVIQSLRHHSNLRDRATRRVSCFCIKLDGEGWGSKKKGKRKIEGDRVRAFLWSCGWEPCT